MTKTRIITAGLAALAAVLAAAAFAAGSLTARPQPDETVRTHTAQIDALIACVRNVEGYPDRRMLPQCIDDWFDANGARYSVDY